MSQTYIHTYSLICSAGETEAFWRAFLAGDEPALTWSPELQCRVGQISQSIEGKYDRMSLLADHCAAKLAPSITDQQCGTVMSSSRGATETFETQYSRFLNRQRLDLRTSPKTTLGNLSSRIAQQLNIHGLSFSLSAACSSSFHAVGVAGSLIKSGLLQNVISGGSEACLTPFTIEQLNILGVLTGYQNPKAQYRPFHQERNGFMIGEGAGLIALSNQKSSIELKAYHGATENTRDTGVSENGDALFHAIHSVLETSQLNKKDIDAVVVHGSGTPKGDASEAKAIDRVFADVNPTIVNSKWLTGHMIGAAGVVNVILATLILEHQRLTIPTYLNQPSEVFILPAKYLQPRAEYRNILVTSLGFGGNVGAMILSRCA